MRAPRPGSVALPLAALLLLAPLASVATDSDARSRRAAHDGSHDFDFDFGTWKTHSSRLLHPRGADIVQEGTTDTGALSRWSFTEITPQPFHWKAEASLDQGASWRLFVAVFARRTRP